MADLPKTIRLHLGLTKEAISAVASETLQAGGCAEAPPVAAEPPPREPSVGAVMEDGTVYAGVSPDTGKAMYATCADASVTMTFNEAKEYATKLDVHGHKDWHVPTKSELNVLFNNRAAIGGFDISGSSPAGWYWSSTQDNRWYAWGHRFSSGAQGGHTPKYFHSSVRCVRP